MKRRSQINILSLLIVLILLPGIVNIIFYVQIASVHDDNEQLHSSAVIDHNNITWLKNPNFDDTGTPWFSNNVGDTTDLTASINLNEASFEIKGDVRTFTDISGVPQSSDWFEFNHFVRPLPLTHEINEFGLNVSHVYDEDSGGVFPNSGDQTANLAGVLWKRNISLPVDMSDYIITSASINAIVNGSADTDIETPSDHPPFAGSGYASLFDFARFYVEISDLNDIESYEIAYNKTLDLGQTYAGQRVYNYATRVYMNDTNMTTVDEDILIFALTQVLKHDNYNFTVTLGIEVDSEDNYPGYELDVWYSLLIKSCELSFTYIKKMDKSSIVSWNQIGNKINGTNVKILDGNLNFRYKIDQAWPSSLSPNSEIRVIINGKQHTETIKLGSATTDFQYAKLGGYNVTSLINEGINISLSIQLVLADNFGLDRNIDVSIDDVYLLISYTETFFDTIEDPWIATGFFIVTAIAAVVLGGFLIMYIKVWRFPIPVRKVRKYSKSLRIDKNPDVKVMPRKISIKKIYQNEVKKSNRLLRSTPTDKKIVPDKIFDKKEGNLPK
ncbi:MAG: hypothetical protein ACTSQU_00345 [Promethearchaeota archaeon]